MNILLMSMPDITLGYPTKIITPPNLGIISLAGNLDEHHRVTAVDLISRRENVRGAVEEAIARTKPDLIGLSAMTFQYDTALKIAKFIKKTYPEIKTALGGYHATLMFREISESTDRNFFDFIFRGESEFSFNETLNRLESGEDLAGLTGLSYKKNSEFLHNENRDLEDLNAIKPPNRNSRLWSECNILKMPFDLIESSRGCLMSCNFCNIRNMYGKSFRVYDPGRVITDIENAKSAGVKIMLFTDDNITLDITKFDTLCQEIIRNGHNDLLYGVQASSAGIASSESLVKRMAEAGFKYVFLGIENASKKNLSDLSKGDIVEKSKNAVKYLRDNGIIVGGGLIIGNPNDDAVSIEESFKFARDLKVDFCGVQCLVPYPKTDIREKLKKDGLLINKDNYKYYEGGFPIARTKFLSIDEIKQLKHKFAKKYFKSRIVNTFIVYMKKRKSSLALFKGIMRLIPDFVHFLIFEKPKRWFIKEDRIMEKHYQKKLKVNEFNI